MKNKTSKEPDTEITLAVVNKRREEHILVSAYGLYENCLKLRPILIMEKEQVNFFADKLESVLKAILEYKTQQHDKSKWYTCHGGADKFLVYQFESSKKWSVPPISVNYIPAVTVESTSCLMIVYF